MTKALGLPSSPDAERAILGAVLLDNSAWQQVESLKPELFSLDSHRRIFLAMHEMIQEGTAIDLVTLSEYLLSKEQLDAIGGASYISSLTDGLPRLSNIGHYVKILRDHAKRRQMIHRANSLASHAAEGNEVEALSREAERLFVVDAPPAREPGEDEAAAVPEVDSIPRLKKPSDCPEIPQSAWHRVAKIYRNAVAGCTEASDNYHFAAFLVVAGSILGRTVSYHMPHPLYPNFFVALYGKSSKARKGTSMNFAQSRLCARIGPDVHWIHSVDSWEGLVDLLVERQQQQQTITAVARFSELRSLIDKANREGSRNIIPNLSDAFDTPDAFERNLARRSGAPRGVVKNPFLAIIGAASPTWLEKLKREDLEGGLGNRFMWIPGERKPRISKPPEPQLNPVILELGLVRNYWKDLAKKQETGSVSFTLSPEADAKWEAFYTSLDKMTHNDPLVEVLCDRLEVHTMKTALTYAALDMDAPLIVSGHIDAAIDFAEFLIRSTNYIFSDFGMDEIVKQERQIVDFIAGFGVKGVRKRTLQKRFWRIDSETLNRRLRWMAGDEGYLTEEKIGRSTYYTVNE